MILLETLQSELVEAILAYCKVAERMEKSGYPRAYSTLPILELNSVINSSTKIVRLHQAMLVYLEDKLSRPFGERVRYALGIARDYDLHNNLLKVLTNPKYHPDKLEMIDERAQWKEEHETQLNNLRQELLAHPEVVANAEIARLRKANGELQAKIERLQKDLQTAQQERDYWCSQHDKKDKENKILRAEKEKTEALLKSVQDRNTSLEKQNNHYFSTPVPLKNISMATPKSRLP